MPSGNLPNELLQRAQLSQFKDGWYIGAFKPSLLPTKAFEVGFKVHKADSDWPAHYQEVATEYNFLAQGRMAIGEQIFNEGDLFIVKPGQIVKPIFVSDCKLVVVKVPSLPGDKVVVA